MNHYECEQLFEASRSLLERSRLVRYSNGILLSNGDEEYLEAYWKENLDQHFGQYMAWVWLRSAPRTWSRQLSSAMGSWRQSSRTTVTQSIGMTPTK